MRSAPAATRRSAAVLTNVVIAGASYGAYGLKMARYTLPYAPFELLAFACPLAMYLAARRACRRGRTRWPCAVRQRCCWSRRR